MRNSIAICTLVAYGITTSLLFGNPLQEEAPFTVSKETTFIDRDDSGKLPFLDAVNQPFAEGADYKNNAARYYLSVFLPDKYYFTQSELDWLNEKLEFRDSDNPAPKLAVVPDYVDDIFRAKMKPWEAEEFPNVSKFLESNQAALDFVIDVASTKAEFSYPLQYTDIEPIGAGSFTDEKNLLHITGFTFSRQLVRVSSYIECRGMKAAGENNRQAALKCAIALHRTSRHIGQQPFLTASLDAKNVSEMYCNLMTSLIAMPEGNKTEDRIDWNQMEWFQIDGSKLSDFAAQVRKDRLGHIQILTQTAKGSGEFGRKIKEWPTAARSSVRWDEALAWTNRSFDKLNEIATLEDPKARYVAMQEFENSMTKLEARLSNEKARLFSNPLLTFAQTIFVMEQAHSLGVLEGCLRTRTREKLIAFAIAARAFHREHNRFPNSAKELIETSEIGDQFFDEIEGKPFQYESKDGVAVLTYEHPSNEESSLQIRLK